MNKTFPFWPLALSIATGIREATIRGQARQAEDAQKRERMSRRLADAQQESHRAAAAKTEAEAERLSMLNRQIERDRREGEYFRVATDDLAVGTFACKDRQIVKHIEGGWQITAKGDGPPARCRTDP